MIHLSWIDKLLDNVKILFTSLYHHQFQKPHTTVIECHFDDYFERQLQELDTTAKDESNTETLADGPPEDGYTPTGRKETEDESLAPRPPGLKKGTSFATRSTDIPN